MPGIPRPPCARSHGSGGAPAHLGCGLAHGSMQSPDGGGGGGAGGSAVAVPATIRPSPESRAKTAATMTARTAEAGLYAVVGTSSPLGGSVVPSVRCSMTSVHPRILGSRSSCLAGSAASVRRMYSQHGVSTCRRARSRNGCPAPLDLSIYVRAMAQRDHAAAGSRWYRTAQLLEIPRWLGGRYDGRSINVPVRLLHGRHDPVITTTLLRGHPDRIPDFRIKTVDAGHWIVEQQSELVLNRLKAFLLET